MHGKNYESREVKMTYIIWHGGSWETAVVLVPQKPWIRTRALMCLDVNPKRSL
jgi:hypothetical protein